MNTALWEAIEAFSIDQPGEAYGFTLRLATEQVWPIPFTENAITEYKKFMYLAATSNQMVSPSPIVDEVWHLHLIYTKSYTEFCNVLGKRIEHIPSTHKVEEQHIFRNALNRTKELYEENFGEQPKLFWNYKNPLDSLELKSFKISTQTATYLPGYVLVFMFFLVFAVLSPYIVSIGNPNFLMYYILGLILSVAAIEIVLLTYMEPFKKALVQKKYFQLLSPLLLLTLKHRHLRGAVHPILNNLILSEKVTITASKKLELTEGATSTDPYETIILDMLKKYLAMEYSVLLGKLEHIPRFKQLKKLQEKIDNTIITAKPYIFSLVTVSLLWSLFLSFGLVRAGLGISRHKPVLFLIITLLAYIGYGVFKFLSIRSSLFKNDLPTHYKEHITPQEEQLYSEWAFLFFGTSALAVSVIPLLHDADPNRLRAWFSENNYGNRWGNGDDYGGGSSCSSGCSSGCGSSCGSGCGGCGGD